MLNPPRPQNYGYARRMCRAISRICAAFECTLIVLPTTIAAFASWPVFIAVDDPGELLVTHLVFNSMMVIAPFSCITTGILLAALAFGDTRSMGPVPKFLWFGTAIGTIVALFGLITFIAETLYPANDGGTIGSRFTVFIAGVPMLLPVAHILLLKPSGTLPIEKGSSERKIQR